MHELIERQRRELGFVRAIVLKGRQQGISTYIAARYFHRAVTTFGASTVVMTHRLDSTSRLFAVVHRFYRHLPEALRPKATAQSSTELYFESLDSHYAVATAGAKDTGRAGTITLFHASEVAYWPMAYEHMAGIGQAVPMSPGTEIIIESTANGQGNLFHDIWQDATRGKSIYVPIFCQWWWQPEYAVQPPPGYQFSAEDARYGEMHGLTPAQLYWRRLKIDNDFRGDESRFQQEYPSTPEEAFAFSAKDSFIPHDWVRAAVTAHVPEHAGPTVMGVDPAEYGMDETAVVVRQGRRVTHIATWSSLPLMETVGRVAVMIERFRPDAVCVDATGVGAGVCDRLMEMGHRNIWRVLLGERAYDDETYHLRVAECWGRMRAWFEDRPVSIPNDQALIDQLVNRGYSYNSNRQLVIESKEKMKRRGLKSPDRADALALTFAVPVYAIHIERPPEWMSDLMRRGKRPPMAA
ncbi:MAG: hypothetical protein NZ518_00010 [Dehalococcoidia bacterium]|nr:hypothetical protein [Dehalococcoidia bacterium]